VLGHNEGLSLNGFLVNRGDNLESKVESSHGVFSGIGNYIKRIIGY
jgi:hypothetical protein